MEEAFSLIRERSKINQCDTRFSKVRLGQCAVGGDVGDGGVDMGWRWTQEAGGCGGRNSGRVYPSWCCIDQVCVCGGQGSQTRGREEEHRHYK